MARKVKTPLAVAGGIAGHELSLEQRVAQLINMLGGQYNVARMMGRAPGSVNNWRKSAERMSMRDMLVLAREAGVSLDWLATGYDRRPDLPTPAGADMGEFVRVSFYGPNPDDSWCELGRGPPVSFRRSWLGELGIDPTSAMLILARDDAMAPEIERDAIILADRQVKRVMDGGIYVLARAGAQLLRRTQVMVDGTVVLIPANATYKEERVPAEQAGTLPIAGQVRAIVKLV
jgi:DNA-binding transcriptional regulator YdaS (Cro superfamily)